MDTVRITLTGGDEIGELSALFAYLRAERELQGLVRPDHAKPGPEDLGGVMEAVTVAVGSGGVVAVLAQSLSGWINSRRPGVRLKITTADGGVLELETTNAADPERLIQELLRHTDDSQ